jgi:hypothetical protein
MSTGALIPAAPAPAQSCQPPSAEHAFEELLDVAEDDSPLEDEAWRIADEQEARGAFETPETVQRIDELARANGLVYDCASRMYHPVSGPDPREAIENGEEPPGSGDDTRDDAPGQPEAGATAPGTRTPGAPDPQPGADGTAPTVGTAGGGVGAPEGGRDVGTMHNRGTAPVLTDDGVPRPAETPDGQGGAIAVPAGSEDPVGNGRTAGIVLLAAGAIAAMATGAGMNRRRRSRQLMS